MATSHEKRNEESNFHIESKIQIMVSISQIVFHSTCRQRDGAQSSSMELAWKRLTRI